jgi:hypothetical protein
MTDEVHKLTLQVRAPRGSDPGRVSEDWYVVVENCVVLTDADGKPMGEPKRHLDPGEDARLVACAMARRRRRNSPTPTGWNNRIAYPKMKF